ncbi:MAG TPA: hypothetical protein VG982_01545 [Candidatus Paceibacterota bacterium]|nr:hypothetical protein [Candidatus Paceibacterota bacterium]
MKKQSNEEFIAWMRKEFVRLDGLLKELGYKEMKPEEYKGRNLIPPRNLKGREKGYIYKPEDEENQMEAIVWTTQDVFTLDPREKNKDTGKNLIRYKGKARYHAKPTLRSPNYVDNMYWKARANKERIDNRPKDSFKGQYMLIENGGKNIYQRYWQSVQRNKFDGGRFEKVSFDHGLSPETIEHVNKRRKLVNRYNKQLRAKGKEPGAYVRRRNPWKKKDSKSEN